MSFTSINFLFFILAVIVLYYLVPKRIQWIVLLISSYVFYMFSGIKFAAFLLFTTATTFFAGIIMGRIDAKNKNEIKNCNAEGEEKKSLNKIAKAKKKWIVAITLILNFGILFILKYYNFTLGGLEAFASIFGKEIKLNAVSVLLPLGISFYIFQSIGYVIDVYRGKYESDRNFAKFALFVSFFPQIIQGPISRYDQLAKQLYAERNIDFTNMKFGIQLAMWGLLKKMIVADRAAVVVNNVFKDYMEYSGIVILFGVVFYCIQLYCDFSGGIDIARGIAQMLGIDMAENFKRPYYATSLSDFWHRWHITLGTWMKDYLFYPLSLSKAFGKLGKFSRGHIKGTLGKILPTSLATFIVFFMIGIWHGGSSKYIFFGLWNGVIITGSILLTPVYSKIMELLHIKADNKFWYVFQIIRTAIIVCIGRYFTRAESLAASFIMLKKTFTEFGISTLENGDLFNLGLNTFDYAVVGISVLVILILGALQEKGIHIRESLEKKNAFIQCMAIFVSIMLLILLGIYKNGYIASEFIYKQF